MAAGWTAVVPVKRLAVAKSRLALPDEERRELVLGFAVDTVDAVSACPQVGDVVVVTAEPAVAERVRRPRLRVVADDGAGLDEAVALGARAAGLRSRGVLVVPGDLPCLRHRDVTQVLAGVRPPAGAFVPDRATTGTTIVVLPTGTAAATRYGPGSAEGHRLLGLRPLLDAPVRARHDVDTLEDLEAALALGVGAATRAALAGVEVGC